MNKLHLEILSDNLISLNKSVEWLSRSFNQTKDLINTNVYSPEQFDQLEVLASRYARTTDMLVNKVLRSIDTLESEDIGTIIDIINRAEKRGFAQSSLLHIIKDLRNNIVHEYKITEIEKFFKDILKYTPILLDIIGKIDEYCRRYLK